ncbi:MAG: hypothetical protein ACM31C_01670 [Acidobacteriota bacterium]
MRLAGLVLVIVTVSCTSSGKRAAPDAAPALTGDAPHSDSATADSSQPAADGPGSGGMVCSGQLYDACNPASSNCASGTCHLFGNRGYAVCTQACSSATPCPDQNGATVTCNGMGICVPASPNPGCTAP